jgi:hypothetical protein
MQVDYLNNPYHLSNDSVIINSFSFMLDSISIFDGGHARVSDISLIIAKIPDNFSWSKSSPCNATEEVSPEKVRSYRHYEFPYPVRFPEYFHLEVMWEDINAADWPSGFYFMGVIVKDEYGYEGFVPIRGTVKNHCNPWTVEVRSAN